MRFFRWLYKDQVSVPRYRAYMFWFFMILWVVEHA